MKVDVASLYLRPPFVLRHEFASSWTEAATPEVRYLSVQICACRSRRRMSDLPQRLFSKEVISVVARIFVRRHDLQAAAPESHGCVRGLHSRTLGA
jgi:hypothetical protein